MADQSGPPYVYEDLPAALARIEELEDENAKWLAEINESETKISELEDDKDDLEKEIGELETELQGQAEKTDHSVAIHAFLDEIHRPVGTQTFTVPQTPAVDRAILALFDAIDRRL